MIRRLFYHLLDCFRVHVLLVREVVLWEGERTGSGVSICTIQLGMGDELVEDSSLEGIDPYRRHLVLLLSSVLLRRY